MWGREIDLIFGVFDGVCVVERKYGDEEGGGEGNGDT